MKVKRFSLYFLVALTLLFNGCDKRPSTNTEAYLELHGIKYGQKNNINIGEVEFLIAESMNFDLETYGEIKKGQADVLRLYLDFSHLLTGWSGQASEVRAEIRSIKPADGQLKKKSI